MGLDGFMTQHLHADRLINTSFLDVKNRPLMGLGPETLLLFEGPKSFGIYLALTSIVGDFPEVAADLRISKEKPNQGT